jgi:Raf kinase inhibitor-like YbhB/YbcL family protein
MQKIAFGAAAIALSMWAAPAAHAQMKVTSDDIKEGAVSSKAMEANVFGCKGDNISPSLTWTGAPDGTKSFAINLYDPDAPTGSGFWHWVVFNIPISTMSLPKDAGDVKKSVMPAGAIQARNDYGFWGFGGMCPPEDKSTHHYKLTVYAVDEDKLQFAKDKDVPAPVVGFELHYHSKAKAELNWTYSRP